MKAIKDIKELNITYRFQIEEFGLYYKITSRFDVWFVKKYDSYNNRVQLYHGNIFGKCNMHRQLVCEGLRHLFSYIKSHDNKYFLKVGVA